MEVRDKRPKMEEGHARDERGQRKLSDCVLLFPLLCCSGRITVYFISIARQNSGVKCHTGQHRSCWGAGGILHWQVHRPSHLPPPPTQRNPWYSWANPSSCTSQPSLCAAGQVPHRRGDSFEKQFICLALTSAQHKEEQQAEGGREESLWGREVSASLAPPEKRRDVRFPSCSLPSSLACLPSSPGPDNPAHFRGFQQ